MYQTTKEEETSGIQQPLRLMIDGDLIRRVQKQNLRLEVGKNFTWNELKVSSTKFNVGYSQFAN